MGDGFPSATSTRARRGRSAASSGAAKPAQASIDDFLGGGGPIASVPVSEPVKGIEPGGWVTDKSGVETYEPNGTTTAASPKTATNWEPPTEQPLGMKPATAQAPMRPGELDDALARPKKSNSPEMHPAYMRIIRTAFAFDPDKVFDELNDKLRFDKPMKDMGYLELAEALDEAARLHRNASLLHADAEVKRAQFDADCETIQGDMRIQATTKLKQEKDEKGGKQITNVDVEARMAIMFPDEYRRQVELKAKIKATVGHLETLVKVWELRRREIDTMLRECRK